MKKLLIILLILPVFAQAQRLDTVYVRNLTMQSRDWAYMTGKFHDRSDSMSMKTFRKMRVVVQANQPASFTASVTFDSIPGKIIVEFYRIVNRAPAGEIALRYAAITAAISAKTVLAPWLSVIDAGNLSEYIRFRDLGKNDLIDQ